MNFITYLGLFLICSFIIMAFMGAIINLFVKSVIIKK